MPLSTDVLYTHKCADYGRDLESLIGVLMVLYYLCAHYQVATKKKSKFVNCNISHPNQISPSPLKISSHESTLERFVFIVAHLFGKRKGIKIYFAFLLSHDSSQLKCIIPNSAAKWANNCWKLDVYIEWLCANTHTRSHDVLVLWPQSKRAI